MKLRSTFISVVGMALVVGCGGNGADNPQAGNRQPDLHPAASNNAARRNTPAVPAQRANIPVDARYTLELAAYAGAGHEQQAKLAKDNLVAQTGRTDFWINHEPDRSTLMFGYYRAISHDVDPLDATRADKDLAFLRTVKNNMGQPMFRGALKVSLPTPDPVAPPEFNLVNLDRDKPVEEPSRRWWTIVIAAYTSDARGEHGEDRKQMAVDAVLAARAKGIPAYYYHGDTISQVCVGAWPRTAVREQEGSKAESRSEYEANAGQSLVVSPAPLGDAMTKQLQSRGDVKVFQPKIDILDPDMLRTQQSYPEYSVNGQVQTNSIRDPHTGRMTMKPQPSFLTQIPIIQRSLISGGGAAADQAPPPNLLNPTAPTGPAGGRLRQIER